jgi:organic radical activating enzyme
MKKPIEIINKDYDEYLSIQYDFTNVCNYKCNYCWPESHAGTSRWPEYDVVCKNFDHLISVYKTQFNKNYIRFHLIGGEPTLWPRLGDFAKFIYDKHNCRMTMSTNGSRTLRWWDEYAEYFNDIQVSVHHEFVDLEHIKQVLDCIYSKGTVMTAAMVLMDPLAWNKCVNIVDQLVKHPVQWMVKSKTLVESASEDVSLLNKNYTQDHQNYLRDKIKRLPPLEYISKMKGLGNIQLEKTSAMIKFEDGTTESYSTFRLYENKTNSFVGWSCNLGLDRINIRPDGTLTGSCGESKIFGKETFNINDKDFTKKFIPTVIQPVICSIPFCGCSAEVRLPKKKYV